MTKTEMTHITYSKDVTTGDIIFLGRVCDSDLVGLDLDKLDRMVIGSPIENAADVLQSLEIIFRRLGKKNARAS